MKPVEVWREGRRRALNALIAIDQCLWCLLTLGHADPDMTLSASAYRSEQRGKAWARVVRPVIDAIFEPLQSEHCRHAFVSEVARRQIPKDMR